MSGTIYNSNNNQSNGSLYRNLYNNSVNRSNIHKQSQDRFN